MCNSSFATTEFRIGCPKKIVAAHSRFVPASQRSQGREDMAEGTCSFTVVSPLSVFVALRGPPLKMQEDTSVGLVNETSCTSDIDVTYGK